jgi:hypothetical protein
MSAAIAFRFKIILVAIEINNSLNEEMQTDDIINWICQYCGEENQVWVDLTVLEDQDFIEDCEVCCRPNRILIKHDKEDEEYIFVESRITDE